MGYAPMQDEVPADEPAIPPGSGAMCTGVIREYDASKGFGFVRVDGMEERIFFPREALPQAFRLRQQAEMPNLTGVQVSFDPPGVNPKTGKGLRVDNLQLLLKYH